MKKIILVLSMLALCGTLEAQSPVVCTCEQDGPTYEMAVASMERLDALCERVQDATLSPATFTTVALGVYCEALRDPVLLAYDRAEIAGFILDMFVELNK